MVIDIYRDVHRCIRLLRDAGREEDAEAPDRALCGSTSGEILCGTGAALKAALQRRPRLEGRIRDRLRLILREIDRVLRASR